LGVGGVKEKAEVVAGVVTTMVVTGVDTTTVVTVVGTTMVVAGDTAGVIGTTAAGVVIIPVTRHTAGGMAASILREIAIIVASMGIGLTIVTALAKCVVIRTTT